MRQKTIFEFNGAYSKNQATKNDKQSNITTTTATSFVGFVNTAVANLYG